MELKLDCDDGEFWVGLLMDGRILDWWDETGALVVFRGVIGGLVRHRSIALLPEKENRVVLDMRLP